MSTLEEFESLLKEVVNAKRLSASKMTSLKDLAMKNVKHDTQLVSALYRMHMAAPSPSSKISSLYVFDALARLAKTQSARDGTSGDMLDQSRYAAAFLLKMGGVVEGIFQDMVSTDNSEAKEKSKKILDIWLKGNTFPSVILTQLSNVLDGTDKVPETKNPQTVDPRLSATNPILATIPPSVTSAGDPQAALLALLAAAAGSTNVSQASSSLVPGSSQLDAAQLAILRQLTHTAASVPSNPQSFTPPDPVNAQSAPSFAGLNGSPRSLSPYRDDTRSAYNLKTEQKYDGYRSPENDSHTYHISDDRDNARGRYRGGYRGRGRTDKFGRWDERDRYRVSDKEGRSPPYGGRSRSRSPSRSSGRREPSRFRSPPRRQLLELSQHDSSAGRQNSKEAGKDEFGRDIRHESPKSPSPVGDVKPLIMEPVLASNPVATGLPPEPDQTYRSEELNSRPLTSQLGLESFDISAFEHTDPACWDILGKMWLVTNGHVPSMEQLMQFIIAAEIGRQVDWGTQTLQTNQSYVSSQQNYYSGNRGRGRGGYTGGRGRAADSTMYGKGRRMVDGGAYDGGGQQTDAIVLGGGEESDNNSHSPSLTYRNGAGQVATSSAGRMQKVGDKWVFVRGA